MEVTVDYKKCSKIDDLSLIPRLSFSCLLCRSKLFFNLLRAVFLHLLLPCPLLIRILLLGFLAAFLLSSNVAPPDMRSSLPAALVGMAMGSSISRPRHALDRVLLLPLGRRHTVRRCESLD